MRLLNGYILPRKALNFTHSHLDFKKIFPGSNPRTPAYRGEERIKGLLRLKEGEGGKGQRRGERDGRGKERRGGPATGGSCSKVLGDRRP